MKSINTAEGKFNYTEVTLQHGQKKINKKTAKENLLKFHSIIEKTNISYGLYFGTLLGAIRENDFIDHDEDTDIYVLGEDKDLFINQLFEFRKNGLELVRASNNLMSFMRNGDYIDVYFFKRFKRFKIFNYRSIGSKYHIKEKYVIDRMKYNFMGEEFFIPSKAEKVLRILYGKDWRTPKKNYHAPW